MKHFLSLFLFLSSSELIYGSKICNILDYGAIGDGVTMNTEGIQAALDACANDGELSDLNQVVIPEEGVFLTGSVVMHSGQELYVESGGMLLGSENEEDYPLIDILPSYGTGRDVDSDLRYRPLVFGENLTHVAVSGGGVIDGNGGLWWQKHFKHELKWSRPRLIEFMYSEDITVQYLTLQNAAFWTVHPYASSRILVQGLTVLAPGYAPNTDGVDPDSCKDVIIQDCYFSLGDDGVAIKSGYNEYGRDFATPSENIYIRNITIDPQLDNLSTNGISIGSEMSGGVRNVTIEDVHIVGCEAGLYIKSDEGRGGFVEDISYRNIYLNRTLQAIKFVMHYSYRRKLGEVGKAHSPKYPFRTPEDETIPTFRNIHVRDVYGEFIAEAGVITGLEESLMKNVSFSNVTLNGALGFYCQYAIGTYDNVSPSLDNCFVSL